MSAFTKSGKTSRWGSLLQGAVANLESRLDTILAEEGASKRAVETARPLNSERSRSPRTSRESDTRPDALSGTTVRDDSLSFTGLRSSSDIRPSIPVESADHLLRQSQDPAVDGSIPRIHIDATNHETQVGGTEVKEDDLQERNFTGITTSSINTESQLPSVSNDIQPETSRKEPTNGVSRDPPIEESENQTHLTQLKQDYEAAEIQRQEEVHNYIERIDALQSKLQYFANEAAESARLAGSESTNDSIDRKLAAKNEQVALLMEEGRRLSKTELEQSILIKKLRAKSTEDSRILAEAKRKLALNEKLLIDSGEKAARLEANNKETSARAARLTRVERELDEVRKSRDTKDSAIDTLRRQVDSSSARAEIDQKRAVAQAVEAERKVIQSLQDDIASMKIEKQLSEDKARLQLKAANEELQRERERSVVLEQGLRNEILALESKLEIFRVRTEEVSSGTTSDSQAKLMRQIETLQAQYSQASENWQGIESSLQARLHALELEKDEASRQESEARRKARESNNSARNLQDQLDDVSRRCNIMDHELNERQAYATKLHLRVAEFEQTVQAMKGDFERERQSWETNMGIRLDEEKTRWRQELNQEPQSAISRLESPMSPFTRRPYGLELPSAPTRRTLSRNTSVDFPMPPLERQFSLPVQSRRSSAKVGRSTDPQTPNGLESGRSTPYTTPSIPYNIPETPSIHTLDQDDPFETGSSPHQTVNDAISVSTAAAGPSVQLVERMSATVRRLESEKAASKDEMARIAAQRDGARKEVVSLMREVDAKRAVDTKVTQLEQDLVHLGQRYQTTLEMLGEKSERVEELEADVADLKKIYRELIENTVK